MNQPATPVEQVVQFSCAGQPVFGIKHTPPGAVARQPKTGVIFINAGVRSRRGPKRLYVRFARRLSQAGYHVLRFDLPGIGDSPGELKNVSAYKKKFLDCTDSTVSAIDYFKKVDDVERIAVVGLCGGAYSALAASAVERRIDWLVLTSLPVQDLSDMSEKAMSDINTHSYFSKIFAWRAWYKFFTGKSHYVWMLRAVARLLTGRYRRPELDPALWAATTELFATGRKALFLYGDRDPLYQPFKTEFRKRLDRLDETHYTIHVVENADHSFSQIRWQDELMDRTLAWFSEVTAQADTAQPDTAVPKDPSAAELTA